MRLKKILAYLTNFFWGVFLSWGHICYLFIYLYNVFYWYQISSARFAIHYSCRYTAVVEAQPA